MRWFLAVFLALTPMGVFAQDTGQAALVADSVTFTQASELTASGNVEVLHNGTRLRARKITYDGATDSLRVTGPIYILDEDGTAIAAEYAQLSGDLREGVLQSARLVFDERLQLAAAEIRRSEGRYTRFSKTVASTCRICADDPTPLWEVRARHVIHDAETRQLYFDNASLRVMGVPVLYTPYLRLPDPSVERASGFLVPEFRSNGDIGAGLRVPYFFTLGDHADITLAPWFTGRGSKTLETRYRSKLGYGEIEVNGAVTDDNRGEGGLRGYLFADGSFVLPAGFSGMFDVELTSDPGYLLLYDYSEKDRLDSEITVERAERDAYIGASIINYRSLRDDESNSTVPTIVGDAIYTRRFAPDFIGGLATVSLEAGGHIRTASSDPTRSGLARDIGRLSAVGNWRRDWLMNNGMILGAEAELRVDRYNVVQDRRSTFDDTTELTPYAALEWRWPMLRQSGQVTHLLEPVAQIVVSRDSAKNVDNEDSLLVEFDEGNIFSFSRFPGVDARERGRRVNLGLTYTRNDPAGWDLGLTVGRVIRERDLGQFSASTGLQGKSSDWLVAAQLRLGERLDLVNRIVFDDTFTVGRNETRINWTTDTMTIGSSYVWLEADTFEGRPLDTSEFTFDGTYRMSRHWTLLGDLRYDFQADRATRAGVGISYQNECAQIDLSVSRRFTSSSNVDPTTRMNLSVQLAGFGANRSNASFTRQCNG